MKLNWLILLLILITLSVPAANAVPDSIATGPYQISFDIGLNRDDYIVDVKPPIEDETLSGEKRTEYPVWIINKTGDKQFMSISVITLGTSTNPMMSGPELKQGLELIYANDPRVSGLNAAARTIDGRSGAVASMNYKFDSENILTSYDAMYQPIFDPHHSLVRINSLYPWNGGTLQLLKTIHVEKVK